MKTLLRWLMLLFTLFAARVLFALAIFAGVIFAIGQGMQSLGLQPPTLQQIDARLDAARVELRPLLSRIRGAVHLPPAASSAQASAPQPAQN
jgi:hypothetical protein